MAVNFQCHPAGQNKRLKTKSIGSPDPMDAYFGCFETGSDSEDDEWMITDLIDPIESLSSSSEISDCLKQTIRPEQCTGKVEYKLKLVNPTGWRIKQLISQMQWRLREGQGEAIYEVGFGDDGLMHGLTDEEMEASIKTLAMMADDQGATVTVLRRRSVNTPGSEGNQNLSVAEVLVRKAPGSQKIIELRVALLGNTCVGKSTLIGVLTSGVFDNGNGSARISMFRHKHEIQSGHTSSVSYDILGFNSDGQVVNYEPDITQPFEISERCSKLLTFIDLAGKEKYLKTTIRGLTTNSPHYAMLIVSAQAGVAGTTRKHLDLALSVEVPFFIVVTKQDRAQPKALSDTIHHLENLLTGAGYNKVPFHIKSEDDVMTASATALSEQTVPIFVVSSVTGRGLDLLKKFLHLLPPGPGAREREKMEQEPVEFEIYEPFYLPNVGKSIVGGLLTQGILSEAMNLLIGPLEDGSFHPVRVLSIERYKYPCRLVRFSQYATLALDIELPSIRKGMILCDTSLKPQASQYFQATIFVQFHSTSIHIGFHTTVHIGSIEQTAEIEGIMGHKHITTNDTASVLFRFVQHPEFIRLGSRILFRTGSTRGIGNITQIFPIGVQQQFDCEK